MKIKDIQEFSKKVKGKIYFDHDIKKKNWFNIGGIAKIYFQPESLEELILFLKIYKNRGKIFVLGAGSNILFQDNIFNGVVIKLGKNFSKISILHDGIIVAGSSSKDRQLSDFAHENGIGGFEFLSCIPGTIGGGLRMNSGCFDKEFKDILISVQALDLLGKIHTIPANKIKFEYRKTDLDSDFIFLSASFKGKNKDKKLIKNEIDFLKKKKEISQPSKIKTGGSTFKNPVDQTNTKVWELIKSSVPLDTRFGDAIISEKHCNFFINRDKATCEDMKKLIKYVKDKVFSKKGIKLNLEIIIVD